jgi:hypothetical protein
MFLNLLTERPQQSLRALLPVSSARLQIRQRLESLIQQDQGEAIPSVFEADRVERLPIQLTTEGLDQCAAP